MTGQFRQFFSALAYLHGRAEAIVHGDLKPVWHPFTSSCRTEADVIILAGKYSHRRCRQCGVSRLWTFSNPWDFWVHNKQKDRSWHVPLYGAGVDGT